MNNNKHKLAFLLSWISAMMLFLSACSSDDVAQLLADETVTVSGTISRGAGPEAGATVKAFYRNIAIPTVTTTTAADGSFTVTVLKNTPVSLQVSGANMVTLNSGYESSDVDLTGYDIEVITVTDVDAVINQAFPGNTLGGGQSWLALNVWDATDTEIGGATITTTANPLNMIDDAALNCDGTDSTGVTTIACPARGGPMYLGYFSADTEVTVAVTGSTDQQIAPVRVGEVTFLEFIQ